MLDVSYNRLREVSAGSFRHLRHLQRLHLQHNHLTTIDARDLAALTPRTHAIVHHNPWACTCSLLKSLQQLQNCAVCQHQVRLALRDVASVSWSLCMSENMEES